MRVYGPVPTTTPGAESTIITSGPITDVVVTPYRSNPFITVSSNGTRIFAGPRDDPFFFDLGRFREIIGGTQSSFRKPGVDAFAGTNVMAIVVEVPKSLLGSNPNINVWVESKIKK